MNGESSSDGGRKKGKKVMKTKESEKEESSHKGENGSHPSYLAAISLSFSAKDCSYV